MHYFSRVDNFVELKQGFGNTIKYLQNLGHRVVIIGDIPNFDINPESCKYDKNIQKVLSYCSMPIAKFQRQKDIYEPTLIELSSELGVPFITIYEPLCNDTRCNMILNETILYRDNNHLNIPGSILVGKFLSQKLNKVLKVNE